MDRTLKLCFCVIEPLRWVFRVTGLSANMCHLREGKRLGCIYQVKDVCLYRIIFAPVSKTVRNFGFLHHDCVTTLFMLLVSRCPYLRARI